MGTVITLDVIGGFADCENVDETAQFESSFKQLDELNNTKQIIEYSKKNLEDIFQDFRNGEGANIRDFFSLSNQIPLLALNEMDTGLSSYMENHYEDLCNYLARTPNDQTIEFTSFYDPNDLLGYPIPVPKSNNPLCENGNRVKVARVTLNNARPFLGIVANPGKAHVGVWKNQKLIKAHCEWIPQGQQLRLECPFWRPQFF